MPKNIVKSSATPKSAIKNKDKVKSPKSSAKTLMAKKKVKSPKSHDTSNTSLQSFKELLKTKKRKRQSQDSITSIGSKVSSLNTSIRSAVKQSKFFSLPPKPKNAKLEKTPLTSSILHEPLNQSQSTRSNPWTQHLQQTLIDDSQSESSKLFDYLIQPVSANKFFRDIWEKKPLLVRRHNKKYNEGLFSTQEFNHILNKNDLHFTRNVDVVTYNDGVKQVHNPQGPARAPLVWNFYNQGCSIRLLNPQQYSTAVHATLSLLQEFFTSMPGANVYLTPPGSQGFAPHYDDIEAFVLQLEGSKQWKVYEPLSEEETLPRFSSRNYKEDELGEAVLDVLLEEGDLLYFPRGFIHQAQSPKDTHSLHMTISFGQKNSWSDLMQILLPRALELATEENLQLREGLPRDLFDVMGIVNSDVTDDVRRGEVMKKISELFSVVLEHAPVDSAVDQMAKKYVSSSLPPCLTEYEKKRTIDATMDNWSLGGENANTELSLNSKIKIVRKRALRLVTEEQVHIYHNIDNDRTFDDVTREPIVVSASEAEAIEFLLKAYPSFLKVKDLPMNDKQEKLDLAQLLFDRGLLITHLPIHSTSSI